MGRLGSHEVRRLGGDPSGKFHRYLIHAPGRPEFFGTPCVPLRALAAVEAASASPEEASSTDDL